MAAYQAKQKGLISSQACQSLIYLDRTRYQGTSYDTKPVPRTTVPGTYLVVHVGAPSRVATSTWYQVPYYLVLILATVQGTRYSSTRYSSLSGPEEFTGTGMNLT